MVIGRGGIHDAERQEQKQQPASEDLRVSGPSVTPSAEISHVYPPTFEYILFLNEDITVEPAGTGRNKLSTFDQFKSGLFDGWFQ